MDSNLSRRSRTQRPSRNRGFTLIEAIVAIVMFTVIIMALSQAFSVALQSTQRGQHRQADDGAVRAIFDVITRDILAAYPSMRSPVAIFSTSGPSSGGGRTGSSSGTGDLLTFSALSTRLQAPELDTQNAAQTSSNQATSLPQSDMGVVKYNFDGASGTLYRIVTSLPYAANQSTPAPTQDQAIAQNIQNIQIEFWDQTQGTWRTDWDYEEQNQIGVVPLSSIDTTTSSASSSTSGASGSTASQGTANTTLTGDANLPTAVRITVTLMKSTGQSQDYVTTIPIGTTQGYLDPNQTANVNTNPLTTTSSSSNPLSRSTPGR